MIRTGDVLHNPATGELMRFVKAAADTNGEYVIVDVIVEPNGSVAAAHLHPYQTETFEVLEGEVTFKVGRKKVVAKGGQKLVVEPGTAHKFWNSGDTDARFRCEIRPALQFEQLIETMFSLAQDGKTNKKGIPRTRFRPDTRLDRGGQDVGSHGGGDGGAGWVCAPARRSVARRAARGALERAPQGGGGAAPVARRVAGSVGAGDGAAGGADRLVA
jgi:quercetin dioxygenase-like cupin family protein